MLTDNDLSKVRSIIKEETDPKFDIVSKQLKVVQKGINQLIKSFNFLDERHQESRQRLNRIEDNLKLPPLNGL